MDRVMRVLAVQADQVPESIDVDRLDDDQKKLIKNLGLPGTERLFDRDPQTARAAIRDFLRSFLSAGPDHEQE